MDPNNLKEAKYLFKHMRIITEVPTFYDSQACQFQGCPQLSRCLAQDDYTRAKFWQSLKVLVVTYVKLLEI
ncbi:hypothetical protein NL676_033982 [Syzygium grande]|nr:hypothetical protein NL676_033982 [Syzygium grande]